MADPITLVATGVMALLDKVIPDKDEAKRLAHEIATLATNQAHEIAKLQIQTNQIEAQHRSLYVASWRPTIGYVCAAALANNYLIVPYVTAFSDVPIPELDMTTLLPVLGGLLGLGGLRTYEKVRGVTQ